MKFIMGKKYILENEVPFSLSLLWKLQKNAYEKGGPRAWEITNNPYLAYTYAHLIAALLKDYEIDPEEPVYLIELGAGGGRFSYLLIKELNRLLPKNHLCLIISDVVEGYLPFWEHHPCLAPYLKNRQIDFALFDPAADEECFLIRRGITLNKKNLKNPLIAIANYLFAALPNDLFRFEDNELKEGLVTIHSPVENLEELLDRPRLMKEMEVSFEYRPLQSPYEFQELLNTYQKLPDTPVLLPVQALRILKNLHRISGAKFALIAGDKGLSDFDELKMLANPQPIVTEKGDINVDVNAHALFTFASSLKGKTLKTPSTLPTDYWTIKFCNWAFLFGAQGDHTNMIYQALFGGSFTPFECFKLLNNALSGKDAFSLNQIVSFANASHHNPLVLHFYAQMDLQKLMRGDQIEVQLNLLKKIQENYYWISKEDDAIGYTLAQGFYYLGQFTRTEELLKMLIALSGPSDQFHFFLGLCYETQGHVKKAIKEFQHTLSINPRHPLAGKKLDILK